MAAAEPMPSLLGAIPLGADRCHFRVWAPLYEHVAVHITAPADRMVPLDRTEHGYHEGIIDGVSPGVQYRYRLTGGVERPDPASRLQPAGVHGPSQVVAADFSWHDDTWRGRPLADYVIYELHVGTFTPEGTFDAAIGRLDALLVLGVTAVEIMPVAQFPGGRNWGYDGTYLFAAQNTYGGPHGLARLVDACHARGLAAVLDVVYNHLGPEGNYLADFGPYFTDRYKTDWGRALNFDGPHSDSVRHYFVENALWWLRDLHIDALRLDAVNYIQDHSPRHFLEELAETVHGGRWDFPRYLIAEFLLNDPKLVRPREQFGYGLDAQWCDDFHHGLHALVTGERQGYYVDFGGLEPLARAYRQGYHFTGQYSRYRQRRHGREPTGLRADQLVIFAQNHDQTGNRQAGERLGHLVALAAQKLAAAAVLLAPNIPLLFMGEEYGETAPFQFFTSHGDKHLIEAVRAGRQREFAAFGWHGETPDPQAEATFERCKLNWKLRDQPPHRELLDWYCDLLRQRRTHPALTQLSHAQLEATALDAERVLLLRRWRSQDQAVLILHFADHPADVTLPLPAGSWHKLLDSSGTAPLELTSNGTACLHLGEWQALVFEVGGNDVTHNIITGFH